MAHLTVSVPKDLVDDLRQVLMRAHAERAAALRRALDAYLVSHERLDEVEGALVELVDLHEAIGQLGWEPAMAYPQPVELSAHPEVLADALTTAARLRVARLLVIGDHEAAVVVSLADGRRVTLADLQAELDLSPGGARALVARLEDAALVVREPDPQDPRGVRLRLSSGAERELDAALQPFLGWLHRMLV
jgi:DNA-binding MarR family transcriptional regulator